jgi:hypothetical protein
MRRIQIGKRNEDSRSFTIEVDNGCARYQKARNAVTARAEARRVQARWCSRTTQRYVARGTAISPQPVHSTLRCLGVIGA